MSLVLEHVNYIYGQGSGFEKQALMDVNLTIGENEFIGLIGHTGSGKSTLTQICNGLIKPTGGIVRFNGRNIWEKGFSLKELRSKVGLVFQYPEHQLFEDTVIKDVCFGPKNLGMNKEAQRKCAEEALQLVGLPRAFFEKSPFELSGGQKRRVAIAGVIAMRPKILILDEPTAGLDPRGRDDILDMVKSMHKEMGITIVLVSHSMEDVAKYVDRILVMNQSRLAFDDTPRAVFAQYKELETMGLAAPEITYIMNDLKEKGLPVDLSALTVSQGRDSILKALQSGKTVC